MDNCQNSCPFRLNFLPSCQYWWRFNNVLRRQTVWHRLSHRVCQAEFSVPWRQIDQRCSCHQASGPAAYPEPPAQNAVRILSGEKDARQHSVYIIDSKPLKKYHAIQSHLAQSRRVSCRLFRKPVSKYGQSCEENLSHKDPRTLWAVLSHICLTRLEEIEDVFYNEYCPCPWLIV